MPEKTEYTEKQKFEAHEKLMAAVKAEDTAQVEQVIEDYGDRIDPNLVDKCRWTAFTEAAWYRHPDIVKAFINADQENKFAKGIDLFFICAALSLADPKTAKTVIKADQHAKDRNSKTKQFFENKFDALIKPTIVGLVMGLLTLSPGWGLAAFGLQLGADYLVKKGKIPNEVAGDALTALSFGVLNGFPGPIAMAGATVLTMIAQLGSNKARGKVQKKKTNCLDF